MNFIPQSQIYSILNPGNPLHHLACQYPRNMCWLTSLFYALQILGFENNRKLHYKLSYVLSSSIELLFIDKNTGAMMFPRKYELSDGTIKERLQTVFNQLHLKIKVTNVLSDITAGKTEILQKYLSEGKALVAIVSFKYLYPWASISNTDAGNHSITITGLTDHKNGRINLRYLDPSDGILHTREIGIHEIMQLVQYIWVIERKKGIIDLIQKSFRINQSS